MKNNPFPGMLKDLQAEGFTYPVIISKLKRFYHVSVTAQQLIRIKQGTEPKWSVGEALRKLWKRDVSPDVRSLSTRQRLEAQLRG